MSPKGPVAPAPTASERRKNRRFGLILLGTIVVALIPVLLVVAGFYPKPGADSPADSVSATSSSISDSLVSSSVVASADSANSSPTVPEVQPAQPVKPSVPWWQKAWNTVRKLAGRKRPETDMAPPLPAPSAAADSVKPDSLLEQAVQGAVDMAASPFGDSLPTKDSAKAQSTSTPAPSTEKKAPLVAKKEPTAPPVIVASDASEKPRRSKAENLERDSLLIRDFRVHLRDKGYLVRGDLMLYSLDRGISGRYPAFAPAIQVAIENIFYITPTENLRIPRLEALLAQQVAFVFPQGAVNRVELRNLHTEWENR